MRRITHEVALAWIEEYRQAVEAFSSIDANDREARRASYLGIVRQEYRIERVRDIYDSSMEDDEFSLDEYQAGKIQTNLNRLQGAVEFAMWLDSDPGQDD